MWKTLALTLAFAIFVLSAFFGNGDEISFIPHDAPSLFNE